MKKVLSVLVILSILLVGKVKAESETIDQAGDQTIPATIDKIDETFLDHPYNIELNWDAFEFTYTLTGVFEGERSYEWTGRPVIHVLNSSAEDVFVSYSWTPTISGTGAQIMYHTAACVPANVNSESDFENSYALFRDSSCANPEMGIYDSSITYYKLLDDEDHGGEMFDNSLPEEEVCYGGTDDYIDACEGDNGLATAKYRVGGCWLYSNDGNTVRWTPNSMSECSNGVPFYFSVIDTQNSRNTENMKSGDAIGSLTITFSAVE